MHGTYLNKDRIISNKAQPLRAGDDLIFGLPVYRDQMNYEPVKIVVNLVDFRDVSVIVLLFVEDRLC